MSANSITNLLLQAGISRNQISMLTNKGMSSSTSLANMLGKNGSFDELMSLDFQGIDNIANLIQGNASLPTAQMKNMEWGNQWGGGGNGAPAPGLSSFNNGVGGSNKRSIDDLVKALSGGLGNSNNNAVNNANNLANSTNFSNFIQATKQGNNNPAGAPTNDIAKYIQAQQLQQQQQQNQQQVNNMKYSNILQNMASGDMNRNVNQNMGGSDFLSMLNQSSQSMNNFPQQQQQQQNFNPFMQQLGLNQNPMMQLLAHAGAVGGGGGGNNVANLLAQSNGFNGVRGGMNNNILLGQFGQALGGNNYNNFRSNFIPASNQQNTVALIQQLVAAQQQRNVGGADVGAMNNQTEVPNVAEGENTLTIGTKRSMDDVNDGGDGDNGGRPTKKQMTAL